MIIPPTTEEALPFADLTNVMAPVHMYSDSSGFEGGIGASTLLYIHENLVKTLQAYLGTALEHTVYKAEGISLVMHLHLLKGLSHQLTHPSLRN